MHQAGVFSNLGLHVSGSGTGFMLSVSHTLYCICNTVCIFDRHTTKFGGLFFDLQCIHVVFFSGYSARIN